MPKLKNQMFCREGVRKFENVDSVLAGASTQMPDPVYSLHPTNSVRTGQSTFQYGCPIPIDLETLQAVMDASSGMKIAYPAHAVVVDPEQPPCGGYANGWITEGVKTSCQCFLGVSADVM